MSDDETRPDATERRRMTRRVDRRDFLNDDVEGLGVALIVEAGWTSYDILNPSPAVGFGGDGRRRARGGFPDRRHGEVLPRRPLLRDPVPGWLARSVSEMSSPGLQGAVCNTAGIRRVRCPCHGSDLQRDRRVPVGARAARDGPVPDLDRERPRDGRHLVRRRGARARVLTGPTEPPARRAGAAS